MTTEEWTNLHEFDEWLQSSEAMRLRHKTIDIDRMIVKSLLIQPPKRDTMEMVAKSFRVRRKQRPLVVWHVDCVRTAIDNYRRWRRGGVGNMLMQNRTNDDAPHSTTTMPNTDASIDISTRRDFWWSTLLTRAYRNVVETKEKRYIFLHPLSGIN